MQEHGGHNLEETIIMIETHDCAATQHENASSPEEAGQGQSWISNFDGILVIHEEQVDELAKLGAKGFEVSKTDATKG